MLEALIAGQLEAEQMADLAVYCAKKSSAKTGGSTHHDLGVSIIGSCLLDPDHDGTLNRKN
ncbi:MAG: hypothetical protein R2854_08215 [Caldilineaceae bacterium]